MRLHTGLSASEDVRTAAREAVGRAVEAAARPVFAIVFSTDRYDPDALAEAVGRELGPIPWAGCCTAGVFVGAGLLTQGLAVGVFSSGGSSRDPRDDARFAVGVGGPVSVDPRAAGRAAVEAALAGAPERTPAEMEHRAIVLLPDALTGSAAEVVRGAAQGAGAGVSWAGGGAGDNLRYVRTAQFAHGRAWHDRVVAISIDTSKPLAVGIQHGLHAYGPPTLVTRARGATAIELEYESAFDVYQRTAVENGDRVDASTFPVFAMAHPLGIPQANGELVIRDPLAVEHDGSLRCVAEIPDGSIVRVMHGERRDLVVAARAAAGEACDALHAEPGGALVFDCVSRSLMLGRGIREELECLQAGLGADVPLMGCLTFGEVGALHAPRPQFHNKTAVVLALAA